MKLLVIFITLLGLIVAEERIGIHYHKNIGIPLASRIKQAEQSLDFNGGRIIGGLPANLGEFPYVGGLVITLSTGQTSVCTSSLLSNTRLVTAAHCWWDGRFLAVQFVVVLGSTLLFSGGTRITTSNIFAHQSYNTVSLNNDIAIISVPWVTYTSNILPISLPYGDFVDENFVDWWVQGIGYGKTSDSSKLTASQFLSYVDLQVISNSEFANIYGPAIISSTLCTSGASGSSTCDGDSGGPIALNLGGHSVLIGVISFGAERGCELGFPNGHARVTSFIPWIQARL